MNTVFTSYGACNITATGLLCGVNTGFYTTFNNGPFLLRAFRIGSGALSGARDPLTMTIEGSNAASALLTLGSSWTLIYNGSAGLDIDPGRKMFGQTRTVNHAIWYSSFRLLVLTKRGVETASEYTEVEFLT